MKGLWGRWEFGIVERDRLRLALTIGAGVLGALLAGVRRGTSDFEAFIVAAGAWLDGRHAYEAVDPRNGYPWPFPLIYPFTAILVALPFRFLPAPETWFAGLGLALYVWGITTRRELRWAWFALPTFAVIHSVRMVQWPPLLTGSALFPMFGFLLVCKPTIGAALWIAYPTRQALIGGAVFVAISVALWPGWPAAWWLALQSGTSHMRAPLFYWGGPLLLLGALRWRRPEGRLLTALACVPQSGFLYDAVPLFLIPRRYEEGFLLALATFAATVAVELQRPAWNGLDVGPAYFAEHAAMGQWMVWLLYLPCLVMILRRSNVVTEA